jgi:ribose 1,5-bisphosphokinase PhnN
LISFSKSVAVKKLDKTGERAATIAKFSAEQSDYNPIRQQWAVTAVHQLLAGHEAVRLRRVNSPGRKAEPPIQDRLARRFVPRSAAEKRGELDRSGERKWTARKTQL